MWFGQCTIFRPSEIPNAALLADKLADVPFAPCGGLDWFTEGFATPQSFTPELVFKVKQTMGIALRREEKVLPGSVIRRAVGERVARIEQQEGRSVGRKERQELKEQVTDELLPRAFVRATHTRALFVDGMLLVDSAAASKAENLLAKLREALGGLKAQLVHTRQTPSALMTEWLLRGHAAGRFELDDIASLRGAGDVPPEIRIKRQDLTAEEVAGHVRCGKIVSELGLVWDERVAFVLTSEFTLKRIQYLDVLQEAAENHGDNAADLAAASQLIVSANLSALIGELVELMGGWQE
ncbi:recombination-associated protein RdgC [Neisseria bacilliformis]|uniref:recombination-associated protein RdgC n=1 Tax=Neisseria bacilliformis TaxID=267212 RepID=UPI00204D90BD|nr:MAG TPA: putative exonuclease [Caudoviricetes sp.]